MPRESNQIDRSPDDQLKYPQLDERRVHHRWSKEWWDGPLDGLVIYQGVRYWFSFYCDTDEPGNPYYYLAYPLTEAEADFANSWSAKNEQYRKEWIPLGNCPETKGSTAEREIAAQWKLHDAMLPDYTKREPVAWFVSGANASFYGVQIKPA